MAIVNSIVDMIGNTPLLAAHAFAGVQNAGANIFAKLERANPAGSAKDRPALNMILDAEAKGLLAPGGTIIEPTSGNTGIALAALAAARGYRAIFTMPETMSVERRKLLAAYGAEVVLTPGARGMSGAIEKAEELRASIPGAIIAGQFVNLANPEAHERTTGPEIWRDLEGNVAAFIAGVGTGGTITGVGHYLKKMNPAVRIVAVEPSGSPLLSEGRSGAHGLQGIGANFVPEALDRAVIDEIFTVTEAEAYACARDMARTEGILVGITSGAALAAAVRLSKWDEFAGKNIVALLPDSGERYLSTDLFD